MEYSIQTGPASEENQDTQIRSLAELEHEIKEGLATYQQVGKALDEIKAHKLYRPTYKNFKTYLLKRWGISRAHAYRLIAAVKVAEMSPIGDKPKNEHQARKRLGEKRKQPAKPERPSTLLTNLDVEFEQFAFRVANWVRSFSREDYFGLVKRAKNHLESITMLRWGSSWCLPKLSGVIPMTSTCTVTPATNLLFTTPPPLVPPMRRIRLMKCGLTAKSFTSMKLVKFTFPT
jgi:hypothetical protein